MTVPLLIFSLFMLSLSSAARACNTSTNEANCTVFDMNSTICYAFCSMNEILETILREWEVFDLPSVISRDEPLKIQLLDNLPHRTLIVTGFRRVGKTYLLLWAITDLLKIYSRHDVLYINFEDERIPAQTKILTDLIPAIKKIYGQKPKYLFLDELHQIPLWSKWLRRILDQEKIKIIVTGSSSRLSSIEVPTELRGRAWGQTVYPLSFKEFISFKTVTQQGLQDAGFHLDEYLIFGGLPDVVLSRSDAERKGLIYEYLDVVLRRDIMERFNLDDQETIKTVLKLLFNSTSITISKMTNSLNSLQMSTAKTTVSRYLSYIENSYLLKQLYLYSPTVRAKLQYPRKTYFIDNGFLTAMSVKFGPNYGRLWENLVFWQLYRKHGDNLHYYRDERGEVDFCVLENGKPVSLYQVCYDPSDFETRGREVHTLTRVGRRLKVSDLHLISGQIGEKTEEKGIKVSDPLAILT